jgi:hypothetical protein
MDFLPCVYRFFAPQGEKTIDMKKQSTMLPQAMIALA